MSKIVFLGFFNFNCKFILFLVKKTENPTTTPVSDVLVQCSGQIVVHTSVLHINSAVLSLECKSYRLFFLRSIVQFSTQIYMNQFCHFLS